MEVAAAGWTVKAIIFIVISSLLLRCASATTNHSVGGPTGWDLASDLRAWAAAATFYAGDNLVFSYGPTHDVLEVNEEDFGRCRTTNPIKAYNDGETVVQLEEGGTTRYFFCGRSRHCEMGLKLEVQINNPLPSNNNATNGTTSSSSSSKKNPPTSQQQQQQHTPPPNSAGSHSPPDHLPLSPIPVPAAPVDDNQCCCPTSGSELGAGRVSDGHPTKLLLGFTAISLIHARCFF